MPLPFTFIPTTLLLLRIHLFFSVPLPLPSSLPLASFHPPSFILLPKRPCHYQTLVLTRTLFTIIPLPSCTSTSISSSLSSSPSPPSSFSLPPALHHHPYPSFISPAKRPPRPLPDLQYSPEPCAPSSSPLPSCSSATIS